MQKLLVLHTGGTLLKIWQAEKQALGYPTGNQKSEVVNEYIDRLSTAENIETTAVCYKDSNDITEEDRSVILKAIIETDADAILITHGADTLPATVTFLKQNLPASFHKPIALVSSPTPGSYIDNIGDDDNEGRRNLSAVLSELEDNIECRELTVFGSIAKGKTNHYQEMVM
jgi:L-asparaginase/Glu-tRNA(Gln) amidotransferase subunit D